MRSNTNDMMTRNSVFAWIAIATGLILLIPLIAMQFTNEVKWNTTDFAVMALMLFGTGSLCVLGSRKTPRKRRLIIAIAITAVFLFIWAELAVGIFTNLGS